MVDVQVILNIVVAPVGQVAWAVVDGVVPVTADEDHCIREHDTRDSIGRGDAHARHHGFLALLGDNAGIQLDEVRVVVQTAEGIGDARVRVDVLECLVRLEAEVPAELIKAGNIPFSALYDTQYLNGTH